MGHAPCAIEALPQLRSYPGGKWSAWPDCCHSSPKWGSLKQFVAFLVTIAGAAGFVQLGCSAAGERVWPLTAVFLLIFVTPHRQATSDAHSSFRNLPPWTVHYY